MKRIDQQPELPGPRLNIEKEALPLVVRIYKKKKRSTKPANAEENNKPSQLQVQNLVSHHSPKKPSSFINGMSNQIYPVGEGDRNNIGKNRVCCRCTAVCLFLLPLTLILVGGGVASMLVALINVPTTIPTSSTTTAVVTIVTTIALPGQCSNYTSNTDATRLTTYGGGSICDSTYFNSSAVWIRFSGAAGTTIVSSAPAVNHCDSQATGWYTGSYPAVGGVTTGNVCYNWVGNTCNWNNSISVTNCNSYYIYLLTAPPVCSLRYCTA